jgi:protein-serine/threonine kinase
VKISADAVSLLKCLLEKNQKKRIDPKKIPLHPFFKDIDFNDVLFLKIKPPFKPKIVNIFNLEKY